MQRLAEPVEAERLDVELQIGRGEFRRGPREGAELRGCHGQRPAPAKGVVGRHQRLAVQAPRHAVERRQSVYAEDHAQLQMILQVPADGREVLRDGDSVGGQRLGVADPRKLQQMRRVHRPGGQDHLPSGRDAPHDAFVLDLDAGDAPAIDEETAHMRLRPQRQVRSRQGGLQEGARRRPAPPAMLVDLEIAAAFIVAAVEIVGGRDALLGRGAAEDLEHLPGQPLPGDPQFAAAPVIGPRRVHLAVLALQEIGQHVRPAPAFIAELAPVVVIRRLAAHVDHAVDRRRAAEDLAARIGDRAAVQSGNRLGLHAPVGARIAHGVEIADRDVEPDPVVLAARLDQQHAMAAGRGQAVGEHAACTAGANDDEVVARLFDGTGHLASAPLTSGHDMSGHAHLRDDDVAIEHDRLAVKVEVRPAQRNVDVAGRVVAAAELGVGPEREQHIAVERQRVDADLRVARPRHGIVEPCGVLAEPPADMRDGIGARIVEGAHVAGEQRGIRAVAFDRDDHAVADRQRHRPLDIAAEIGDEIARHHDEAAVDAAVIALAQHLPGREMIPAAGRVGVAVLRQHGIGPHLEVERRAGIGGDAQMAGGGEQHCAMLDPSPEVAVGEHLAQDVERLAHHQHPRAGGGDLGLLGREEQAHEVDHDIGRLQRLDGRPVAGKRVAAGEVPALAERAPRHVDLENARAEVARRQQERVGIVGAYVAFGQHDRGLADADPAELQRIAEQANHVELVVHSGPPGERRRQAASRS